MEIWDKNARKNNETTTQVLSTRWLQSRWNGSPRSDRVGMDQRWQLTNDVVHVLENFAFQVSSSWLIITISLFTIGYNFVKFFELTVIKVKTLRLLQKINSLLLRRPLMFMEAIPLPSPMAQSASQIWWSLFKKNANLFLQTISSQNHIYVCICVCMCICMCICIGYILTVMGINKTCEFWRLCTNFPSLITFLLNQWLVRRKYRFPATLTSIFLEGFRWTEIRANPHLVKETPSLFAQLHRGEKNFKHWFVPPDRKNILI